LQNHSLKDLKLYKQVIWDNKNKRITSHEKERER
jgi:hypothetical protein